MKLSAASVRQLGLRLKGELAADKRKTVLLVLLTGGVAGLALKTFTASDMPAGAEAAGIVEADPQPVDVVLPEPRPDDGRRQRYLAQLDTTVPRDLFRIDRNAFTPIDPDAPIATDSPEQAAAKLAADAAVQARQRAEAKVRDRAAALDLQSAIGGPRPTAIIDGTVVTVGDRIEGLEVRHIGAGVCRVGAGEITVTLEMGR